MPVDPATRLKHLRTRAAACGLRMTPQRAVLLERLHKERDHVRDTLKAAETIMDNLARAEVELVRHANERSTGATASTLALTGASRVHWMHSQSIQPSDEYVDFVASQAP